MEDTPEEAVYKRIHGSKAGNRLLGESPARAGAPDGTGNDLSDAEQARRKASLDIIKGVEAKSRASDPSPEESPMRTGHSKLSMPKDNSQTHVYDPGSPEAAASARRAADPNSVP